VRCGILFSDRIEGKGVSVCAIYDLSVLITFVYPQVSSRCSPIRPTAGITNGGFP